MIEFIPQHFERLKGKILEIAGLSQIIPSDCKRLSADIFKKTHKQLSETTLKRVFGFAYSQFNPSVFTINTLAEYCGYTGWTDFVTKLQYTGGSGNSKQQNSSWRDVAEHARKITQFTLQALKNRSGVPFKQTISRKFVDEQLEIFTGEPNTATILTAPAGYGKTTALCHWVDERINPKEGMISDDIILFFSFNVLVKAIQGHSLNDWLLALLGIGADEMAVNIAFFEKGPPRGKFYLILDGLNESDFKRNDFYQLLGQIIDIVSLYNKSEWFKVILTMRSSTWVNNRHFLSNKSDEWFLGFMTDWQQSVNVPLFDGQEIAQLSRLINPAEQPPVKEIHLSNLAHPLYFEYFYQAEREHFSLGNINRTSIYELTSAYVMDKIYKGKYHEDKVLLLNNLASHINIENGHYRIDKLAVHDTLKTYHHAYQELLSTGFLRLNSHTNSLKYQIFIEFTNSNLLQFAIAKKLLNDHNDRIDGKLIDAINTTLHDGFHKLPVLKWCIYSIVSNHDAIDFKALANAQLNIHERCDLILFMGHLFKKQRASETQPLYLNNLFNQDGEHNLFNYFVSLEFIHHDYEQALLSILDFELPNHRKVIVKTCLSLIAILQMDVLKLEKYITELKAMPAESLQCMLINPVHCLESIYFYLRFGIIKKEAFVDITKFYFNPSLPKNCGDYDNINEISLVLSIYTLMLCRNIDKTIRFIKALKKIYPTGTMCYNFLTDLLLAHMYVNNNDVQGIKIYERLKASFDSEPENFTTYMKVSFFSLKIKITLFQKDYGKLFEEIHQFINLCDEENFKLIKVAAIAHLLGNYSLKTDDDKLFNQIYFDFVKTTRSSGCRTESFTANVAGNNQN